MRHVAFDLADARQRFGRALVAGRDGAELIGDRRAALAQAGFLRRPGNRAHVDDGNREGSLGLQAPHQGLRGAGDVDADRLAVQDLVNRLAERVAMRGLAVGAGQNVRVFDVRFALDDVAGVANRGWPCARLGAHPQRAEAARGHLAASAERRTFDRRLGDRAPRRIVRDHLRTVRIGRLADRLRPGEQAGADKRGAQKGHFAADRDRQRGDVLRLGRRRREAAEESADLAAEGRAARLQVGVGCLRALLEADGAAVQFVGRQRLQRERRVRLLHLRNDAVGDVERVV